MMGKVCREDFFMKRWQCPIRRTWLRIQGMLMAYVLALLGWIILDISLVLSFKPELSTRSVMIHSLLTVTLAFFLTGLTYLYLHRKRHFFRMTRLYRSYRVPLKNKNTSKL